MNLPAYGRQILCAGRVHSKKIRSLLEMDTTGLPVIATVQMDSENWGPQWPHEVPPWIFSGPLYVRICFDAVEYPHSFYRICGWAQLPDVIPELISQASSLTNRSCDITIQPHLHERLGGAVAMVENELIIEAVDGNARALLREGQFNYRRIIHLPGEDVEESQGQQTEALVWQDGTYRHLPAAPISWDAVAVLGNFSDEPFCIYEYCILKSGEPLFLEKKPIPKGSFTFKILHGRRVFSVREPAVEKNGTVYHEIPSLDLASKMDNSRLHIFTKGGYLSHLSYFAAEKKIPMIFV